MRALAGATKTRCLRLGARNGLLAREVPRSFDHNSFVLRETGKRNISANSASYINCGVPIQVMVTKYRDYVTSYIPLDSHGDITEFLDVIIVSL